ncbi:hypothetical protein ARSEF4850_002729 [Beauveria asiatica]
MSLSLPIIFLLQTNLKPTELHELEKTIPTLTYDVHEAEVVLGKVSHKERAQFELRRLKVYTDSIEAGAVGHNSAEDGGPAGRYPKRQKLELPASSSKADSSVYYEEFQKKIGRDEVARIANVILEHAHRLDQAYELIIVGGYRRGREENGDVDVILTHKEEHKTLNLVEKLVSSIETDNYITHTLSLSTRNSERSQVPLQWKGEGGTSGTGFDTLDKAMVVWLDPKDAKALHRRVDIIVSPWKTVGCAILGWSGEKTFQRDLRRYCKKEKGLKFDSSGIRNRANGSWVDLERGDASADSMEEAERRVFDGLNIPWRPPWDRCTG